MQVIGRRAALAGAGVVTAGSLAVVMLGRKPPDIASPSQAPIPATQPITSLLATVPPTMPADAPILDAGGAAHHLAEFAGRGVVLNLWATWCVPCVAELPALAALARRLPPAAWSVVAVSSDRGGADIVRPFLERHGIGDLGIWLDPKGDAARAWGARGIPTTLILDRAGRERGRLEGAADWASDAAVERIRALIG